MVVELPSGQRQEFVLEKSNVTIGSSAINDIVLQDSSVSTYHARLEQEDAGYVLLNLSATDPSIVNGTPTDKAALAPGDVITLGATRLRFEDEEASAQPLVTSIDLSSLDLQDLQATLDEANLSTTIRETYGPRLAVYTPNETWEVPLSSGGVTIGRNPNNDIIVDHPTASRSHAVIEERGTSFILRDLKSQNGTWMGDLRVEEQSLLEGRTIRVGPALLVFKRGFQTEELTLADDSAQVRAGGRGPVIFIPGFGGSELLRGDEIVYPGFQNLVNFPDMRLTPDNPLEVGSLLKELAVVPNLIKLERYGRLTEFLGESLGYVYGNDLLEFAYDWRQDMRQSARELAKTIDEWSAPPPIIIIAHSMGCLIARYYVERLGGYSKVSRLILMGGPHHGTPSAFTNLFFGPRMLPFGFMNDEVHQTVMGFPSIYQCLPTYSCAVDSSGQETPLLNDDSWLPEKWHPFLKDAQAFRRELGASPTVPSVSIFGYGLKTVTGLKVFRDDQGQWQQVDLISEPRGDKAQPESTAMAYGSEIHPVKQEHGSLYVDNDVKMRLKLELTR